MNLWEGFFSRDTQRQQDLLGIPRQRKNWNINKAWNLYCTVLFPNIWQRLKIIEFLILWVVLRVGMQDSGNFGFEFVALTCPSLSQKVIRRKSWNRGGFLPPFYSALACWAVWVGHGVCSSPCVPHLIHKATENCPLDLGGKHKSNKKLLQEYV